METVKLSSKGQIVIPKAMRDDLHWPAGTELVIRSTATGLTLTPSTHFPKTIPAEVRGFLAKPGRTLPNDDEIKACIKGRLKANDDASK
jgi:AbrB family looped-hinge helix DNA binding protein